MKALSDEISESGETELLLKLLYMRHGLQEVASLKNGRRFHGFAVDTTYVSSKRA